MKTKLKDAVIQALSCYETGEKFFGRELQDKVALFYPEAARKYVDTILRVARKYCRSEFKVANRRKSLYEKL